MSWFATYIVFAVVIYGGGGVTKRSGIEQFWTDDYKIFDHVYGKTSDKDIYGESLPSIVINTNKWKEAAEKNERYLLNLDQSQESYEYDSYNSGDRYNNLLGKHSLKLYGKKPATSAVNFISYTDFKPISQVNDPDTYNYLKHLDEYNLEGKFDSSSSLGGFKPYNTHIGIKPEETDAYKSIQDILDAHEANKGNNDEDDTVKYLTYPKNKKKKPPRVHNEVTKPRCISGRCRKRGTYRPRSRPYVRGLKIVSVV